MRLTDPRYRESAAAWHIPRTYNIAADVADRHPRGALAMIWVDFTGAERFVRWGEMQDRSRQLANAFSAAGAREGDVVAVCAPQFPETAAAYLAAYRVGAVLLTMSTLWSDEQIAERVRDSAARVLLIDRANADRLDFVGDTSVMIFEDEPWVGHSTSFATVTTRADAPAMLYYTSGTTGAAKGILHAHRNLIGHNEFELCHELTPGDVFYGGGEWAWSYAKVMGPWRYGATQLAYRHERGFEPNGLLAAMSRHRVTSALVNPSMLRSVRERADHEALGRPQWLRNVCSSNEPLEADLMDWFRGLYGLHLLDYYGLSESYPLLANRPGTPVKAGSAGRPLPGWSVELLDHDCRAVSAGEEGEICLRARSNPQYPLGILGDAERSHEIFGGEWFRTGDVARRDDDGYWFLNGRKDDLIKSSGYRIGPQEIEQLLNHHASVAESMVIGVPDDRRGQAVHACVVVRPGTRPSQQLFEELQRLVRTRHSSFAYPREITFVDRLPRSATGRLQRSAFRAAYPDIRGERYPR